MTHLHEVVTSGHPVVDRTVGCPDVVFSCCQYSLAGIPATSSLLFLLARLSRPLFFFGCQAVAPSFLVAEAVVVVAFPMLRPHFP